MIIKELLEKIIQKVNLSQEEASFLMEEIMSGRMSPSLIGAFLAVLRMKGETVDEITGLATVMRSKAKLFNMKHHRIVDTCGTGGDGAKTFNISTLAAFVVAGAGISVAKHGNVAVSSRCGSADLLKSMGIKIDADQNIMEKALDEIGICFLFAPLFHHAMMYAAATRKEIGIRTVFNILGPLSNPVGAKRQVLGVFREDLTETLAKVLINLGTSQAFVVHGEDGIDEITTSGKTRIAHVVHEDLKCYDFVPEKLNIRRSKLSDLEGGDVITNTKIAWSILNGDKGPKRDIVALNAAFAILAGEGAANLEEAYAKANESLDSGNALKKLNKLIMCTNDNSEK